MKFAVFILLLLPVITLRAQHRTLTPTQYRQDFDYFWATINEEYCYFNKKQTDWAKAKEIYSSMIDTATNRASFTTIIEKALNELYDHHAVLNTNTDSSRRLVPSGTDTWAEYVNGKPTIIESRAGFGSEKAGVIAGMEVIAVNDIPVTDAIGALLPKALKLVDNEARSFALRLLLSGNHVQPRKYTLQYQGTIKDYYPDKAGMQLEHSTRAALIESKMTGSTAYIKINDCLYDNDLIPAFDSIMQTLGKARSIILDLRDTPSGGNTTVAKAILGWFIDKEHFYQKHEYYAEEKATGIKRSWEEIVSPRKGKYCNKPLVVLCNHWTGSVAEGIVIGFAGLKRPHTTIIGTELARLNGAVYSFEMSNSRIRFTFPAERLYHINGLPREEYIPPISIDLRQMPAKPGQDVFIEKACQYLKNK